MFDIIFYDIIFKFLEFSPIVIVAMFVISIIIAIVSKIRCGMYFKNIMCVYFFFLATLGNALVAAVIFIPIDIGEGGVMLGFMWVVLNIVAFAAMVVQLIVLEIKRRIK